MGSHARGPSRSSTTAADDSLPRYARLTDSLPDYAQKRPQAGCLTARKDVEALPGYARKTLPHDVRSHNEELVFMTGRSHIGDIEPQVRDIEVRHLAKINYPFMSLAGWYNSIRRGTCLA